MKANNDVEALAKLEQRIKELENKIENIISEINGVNEQCTKLEEVKRSIE